MGHARFGVRIAAGGLAYDGSEIPAWPSTNRFTHIPWLRMLNQRGIVTAFTVRGDSYRCVPQIFAPFTICRPGKSAVASQQNSPLAMA